MPPIIAAVNYDGRLEIFSRRFDKYFTTHLAHYTRRRLVAMELLRWNIDMKAALN